MEKHSSWHLTMHHRVRKNIKSEEGWVGNLGGRMEADPQQECFTASLHHQCASQWAQGKTNYQRNDWRVRRASHSQPPPDGHN